jgi:hypothetical protein
MITIGQKFPLILLIPMVVGSLMFYIPSIFYVVMKPESISNMLHMLGLLLLLFPTSYLLVNALYFKVQKML